MSARRSSGVQRARGGSGWRWLPTTSNWVACASRSRRSVCQSPPLSVARQKHCGVRWAWMSMARITLLSRAPSIIRPPSGGMPVAMADALLEVRDLRTYIGTRRGVVKAVDGATFSVRRGETLGIVGESGSGKSMTCLSILRLVPEPGGRIVGEQIAETLRLHRGLRGRALDDRIVELLRQVRVSDPERRVHAYPHQMSGGIRQRVAGAIAISCQPSLLIADEPTTSLDVTIQSQYLRLLKEIQRETNLALVFVTHDLGIVAKLCDRVAVMYAGRIVEMGKTRDMFNRPRHPYTIGLLNCLPTLRRGREPLTAIDGQPPDLANVPGGCSFTPRCPMAEPRCSQKRPPL